MAPRYLSFWTLICWFCTAFPVQGQLDSARQYLGRDPLLAREFADEALRVAEAKRDSRQAFEAHKLLGITLLQLGEEDTALVHFRASLALAEKLGSQSAIGAAHNNLGNYYNQLGAEVAALEHYLEALNVRIRAGDSLGISRILINIGILQDELGRHEEALESYHKALGLKIKLGDRLGEGLALQNIGVVELERENPQAATENLLSARKIFQEMDRPDLIAATDANLALAARDAGREADAFALFYETIYQYKDLPDYYGAGETELNLAVLLIQRERFAEALMMIDSALSHAQMSGAMDLLAAVHLQYSRFFERIYEPDSALVHLQTYIDIQRDLLDKSSLRHLEEMQSIYQTGLRAHTIKVQQKDLQLLEKQQQFTRLWNTFLGVGLILLALLFIVWKKRKQAQLYAQQVEQDRLRAEVQLKDRELELRNKELVAAAMQIAQKNDLLASWKESLEGAARQTSGEAHLELRALGRQMDSIGNAEKDWEAFRQQFEQVESTFFDTLRERFPQLTQTDLRICALIRLQLQTKEIASILNISPESVTKARYRIKKKMKLDREENLTDFILKL